MHRSSPQRSTLNTVYITNLDMCEVCTWAVHCEALRLNTGYIRALDMCEVCTEAVQSVALWTWVTSQLWTCAKYVPKQSTAQHFEHSLHDSFGHAWSLHRRSPLRSTLNTGYITTLDMCEVCTEAVHSVALWTRVTSQLWDMCEECTAAVHCVALWTRVTSQLGTCAMYVRKQSTA